MYLNKCIYHRLKFLLGKIFEKEGGGAKPRSQNLGNVSLKIVILALFQVKFTEIAFY